MNAVTFDVWLHHYLHRSDHQAARVTYGEYIDRFERAASAIIGSNVRCIIEANPLYENRLPPYIKLGAQYKIFDTFYVWPFAIEGGYAREEEWALDNMVHQFVRGYANMVLLSMKVKGKP